MEGNFAPESKIIEQSSVQPESETKIKTSVKLMPKSVIENIKNRVVVVREKSQEAKKAKENQELEAKLVDIMGNYYDYTIKTSPYTLNFARQDVCQILAGLTSEQIRQYPRIIENAQRWLVYNLQEQIHGKYAYIQKEYIFLEETLEAFKNQSDIIQEILNNDEIKFLRENIFSHYLCRHDTQHEAVDLINALHLAPQRVWEIVDESIDDSIRMNHNYENKIIYDINTTINDFKLDSQNINELKLKYFKKIIDEWHFKGIDLRTDLRDFFITNRELFKTYVYDEALNMWATTFEVGKVENYLKNFTKKFADLEISQEEFENLPENKEFLEETLKKYVLDSAQKGGYLEYLELGEKVFGIDIASILTTPDGCSARFEGLMDKIKNTAEGRGYGKILDIDIFSFDFQQKSQVIVEFFAHKFEYLPDAQALKEHINFYPKEFNSFIAANREQLEENFYSNVITSIISNNSLSRHEYEGGFNKYVEKIFASYSATFDMDLEIDKFADYALNKKSKQIASILSTIKEETISNTAKAISADQSIQYSLAVEGQKLDQLDRLLNDPPRASSVWESSEGQELLSAHLQGLIYEINDYWSIDKIIGFIKRFPINLETARNNPQIVEKINHCIEDSAHEYKSSDDRQFENSGYRNVKRDFGTFLKLFNINPEETLPAVEKIAGNFADEEYTKERRNKLLLNDKEVESAAYTEIQADLYSNEWTVKSLELFIKNAGLDLLTVKSDPRIEKNIKGMIGEFGKNMTPKNQKNIYEVTNFLGITEEQINSMVYEDISEAIRNGSISRLVKFVEKNSTTYNEKIEYLLLNDENLRALMHEALWKEMGYGYLDFDKFQSVALALNLDVRTLASDPHAMDNITKKAQELNKPGNKWDRGGDFGDINFWLEIQRFLDFLGIKEDKFRDLKISSIVKMIESCTAAEHVTETIDFINFFKPTPDEEKNISLGMLFHIIGTLGFSIDPTLEEEKDFSQNMFNVGEKFPYLMLVLNLLKDNFVPAIFNKLIKSEPEKFFDKTPEQLRAYIIISQQIDSSPSQEIVRIKNELIEQILDNDDPVKAYGAIERIFIQNNIPLLGKIQRIFSVLYPDTTVSRMLNESSSPVLRQASIRRRQNVIFQDLLKVHIDSGNRSLKKFLQTLREGDLLMEKLTLETELTDNERAKLSYIFDKLKTLSSVSTRGQKNQFPAADSGELLADYQKLYSQLGVKDGQSVSQRVTEMFASPLGYKNIDEILTCMDTAKSVAEQRSRKIVDSFVALENGDLVKGVDINYIDNILQNGSVAKEYLGASSGSDATPFDTDLELLTLESADDFKTIYNKRIQLAKQYGQLLFVVKDRGQLQKTYPKELALYDRAKYELFKTGAIGQNHYGIRTGFPCTEIDFMILGDGVDTKQRKNLFYSIAQNGYYIPVTDTDGHVVFTPDEYDRYRKVFSGIELFNGADVEFANSQNEKYYSEIKDIIQDKKDKDIQSESLKNEIKSTVLDILSQFNVKTKGQYDDSLLGAELLDIGSTGRGTNLPDAGDFDFNLKLDAKDFDKVEQIAAAILSKLGLEMRESPVLLSSGNSYQLRFFGTNIFSQKGLDIDIGFVKKSELNIYASHDAIADKLGNIRQKQGEDAYQEVIANILLAKKWLKAGNAYKKGDHGQGGLGGIGVENLILAHEGNLGMAFRAFYSASKHEDGTTKGLEEFKKDFAILDAGMDIRSNTYDNFVYNMNQSGYERMLAVIKEHFEDLI